MNYLQEFQENYKPIIDIYYDYSDNFVSIIEMIYSKLNINLNDYIYDKIIRKTETGYRMKFHRDNYMLRKINNRYIFIPFNESKLPTFTLLWYKNDEFSGGTLEFLSKEILKPKKDLFVFFDSNNIHRVNQQLSGIRIVEIYKFYKNL